VIGPRAVGHRRGAMLIETLAAAALLALLIVATLPLLRGEPAGDADRGATGFGGGGDLRIAAAIVAEALLRDPGAFGLDGDLGERAERGELDGVVELPEPVRRRIAEIDEATGPPRAAPATAARLRTIASSAREDTAAIPHLWLRVEVEEGRRRGAALRFLPLPVREEPPAGGEADALRRGGRAGAPRRRARPIHRRVPAPRRGLTLLELLLASTIGAGTIVTAMAWTTTATRAAADRNDTRAVGRAIEAILLQIEREIRAVDADPPATLRDPAARVGAAAGRSDAGRSTAAEGLDRQALRSQAEPVAATDHGAASTPRRVRVEDGAIEIHTRCGPWIGGGLDPGTRVRSWRRLADGRLVVSDRRTDPPGVGGGSGDRTALRSTSRFEAVLTEDGRIVTIVIGIEPPRRREGARGGREILRHRSVPL
jgi:type II secretory pathway pseudopilin PulG